MRYEIFLSFFLSNFYFLIDFGEEEERDILVCALTGDEPATSVYQDDTLTN